MRSKLCQINWHPNERDNGKNAPIRATDFAPLRSGSKPTSRVVATAAQDGTVRLWKLCNSHEVAPAGEAEKNSEAMSDEGHASASQPSAASSAPGSGFRVDYLLDFEGNSMCVNAVRFSPNGECLATAGDDGYVMVWYRTTRPMDPKVRPSTSWDDVTSPKQLQRIIMRGGLSEICDLAWTSDSKYVITGSVDGTIGIWDVCASKLSQQSKDHKGLVQGVACDPLGEFIATQCSSRTVRISRQVTNTKSGKMRVKPQHTIRSRKIGWDPLLANKKKTCDPKSKEVAEAVEQAGAQDGSADSKSDMIAPLNAGRDAGDKSDVAAETKSEKTMNSHALFLDNMSTTTFFRRPSWTPDGSLLIAPTGQFKANADDKYQNTTYIFSRTQWTSAVAHFPIGFDSATVGVRCSPVLYELRKDLETDKPAPTPLVNLPYRMVLAILSTNAVMIYDTQHSHMISMVRNQHFANLTDVAWSNDGNTLFVTSSDGYCSVIEFAAGELGKPLLPKDYPKTITAREDKNWFAIQEAKRAEQAALRAKAALQAPSQEASSDNIGSVVKADNESRKRETTTTSKATGGKKKRRIALVQVTPEEAAAGNLLGAP